MKNEIVKKQEYFPELSKQENEIIQAKSEPRLSEIKEADKIKLFSEAIRLVYFNTGINVKGSTDDECSENLFIFAMSLNEALNYNYINLSIKDIQIALKNGAYGLYGDFMGISVNTLIKWIKCYDEQRKETIFKSYKLIDKMKIPEPIEKQNVEKKIRISILKKYNDFKLSVKKDKNDNYIYPKFIEDYGNVYYDYLDKYKIIPFNQERKKEFMKLAELEIISENNGTVIINKSKRDEARKLLKMIESKEKSAIQLIIIRAKKIALLEFFKMRFELKNGL